MNRRATALGLSIATGLGFLALLSLSDGPFEASMRLRSALFGKAPADAAASPSAEPIDRDAFERFLEGPATFSSLASARRAARRWDDRRALEAASFDLGIPVEAVLDELLQSHLAEPAISESRLRSAFAERSNEFKRSHGVRVQWARIQVEGDEDRAQEHIRALRVRAQIVGLIGSSEDWASDFFSSLTTGTLTIRCDDRSSSPPAFPGQGEEGWRAIRKEACGLRPGSLSDSIRTVSGYFLLRHEATLPAVNVPFDRVRHRLRAELENRARHEARSRVLDHVRETYGRRFGAEVLEAFVVEPTELPDEPNQGPPRPPGFEEVPHDV